MRVSSPLQLPVEVIIYLQIRGRAEPVTDRTEKDAFWEEQLKDIFKGPDDPGYGVMIITLYRIAFHAVGSVAPEGWQG